MWFNLSSRDILLNEHNIIRIYSDHPAKNKILIMAELVDVGDSQKLADFDTAEKASRFITLLQNEISKNTAVIDIQTLINIANL